MYRIVFVQYTNPAAYPPLEHSSHILAKAGWQVLFLGARAWGAETLCFPPHERIEVRQISCYAEGWRQKLHYMRFALWVYFWSLRWRPDSVYASALASCPVALLLSYLRGVHVIYHEHDSPPSSKGSFCQKMNLAARRILAHRAKMCILPNQQRAEHYIAEVGISVANSQGSTLVVWNCPSLDEISSPRLAHNSDDFWVLYHGSIVPSRLPLSVLKALTLLPARVKLCVIGYETIGHRGYVQELQDAARRFDLGCRVKFVGVVPTRADLLAWCRKCDVGLAFMPTKSTDINEQTMAGASNKPFDYLSCGLALLVSDLPDWRRM